MTSHIRPKFAQAPASPHNPAVRPSVAPLMTTLLGALLTVHCGGQAAREAETPSPAGVDGDAPGAPSAEALRPVSAEAGEEPGGDDCGGCGAATDEGPDPTTFPPPGFSAPFERTAAPGDGTWAPMSLAGGEPPVLWTTTIHPDKIKKWVVVALVAMDRRMVDLRLVAGTDEPESKRVPAERRTGLVPPTELPRLIAAMNGGFKARHGEFGMMTDGDVFIPPRDEACTAAMYKDGSFRVRTWTALASTVADMTFYRQTPPCMIEEGTLHEKLVSDLNTKKWGAAEDGKTEIRRSAIGVSRDGRTVFFAIGDWTTAQAMGRGLAHAGVWSAAQLDINYSYTRFTLFEHTADGGLVASSPLLKELKFTQKGYVESPAHRDFFYVAHRR
jgi:hypothetical protein